MTDNMLKQNQAIQFTQLRHENKLVRIARPDLNA